MKLFLLALIAVCSSIMVSAQAPELKNRYGSRLPLALYIEPTAILSPGHNNSLRAGLEVPLFHNLGINLAGSLYTGGSGIKAAVKYYLNDVTIDRGWWIFNGLATRAYAGAEYGYKAHSYRNTDSLKGVREISYDVSKYASSYSVFFGEMSTLRCGVYYEVYFGAGVRIKTSTNTLSEQEERGLYHWHEGFVQAASDGDAYRTIVPHLLLGFRIGYRFL